MKRQSDQNRSTHLNRFTYDDDGKERQPIPEDLSIPSFTEEDFKIRLKEINKTHKIIKDDYTGRAFEIAIVNENRLKDGVVLMPSTMFSSLTQNPGNAVELAAQGAATPHTARVYVAFPGNGGSDSLSRPDRRYFADTGRFTKDDGKALGSISALVRALSEEKISVKSISTNTEGGRFGLGIMAALPTNSVASAYFNGLPGIYSLQDEPWITTMIKEDHKDQLDRRNEEDKEQYKITDSRVEEAKYYLSEVYKRNRYCLRLVRTYVHAMPNILACTYAFNAHDDLNKIDKHAVINDTLAALNRQPNAKITFQFCRSSKLHDDLEQCKTFGQKLTQELSKTPFQGNVQLFVSEGSLDYHTTSPSKRWAAEKEALMMQ